MNSALESVRALLTERGGSCHNKLSHSDDTRTITIEEWDNRGETVLLYTTRHHASMRRDVEVFARLVRGPVKPFADTLTALSQLGFNVLNEASIQFETTAQVHIRDAKLLERLFQQLTALPSGSPLRLERGEGLGVRCRNFTLPLADLATYAHSTPEREDSPIPIYFCREVLQQCHGRCSHVNFFTV